MLLKRNYISNIKIPVGLFILSIIFSIPLKAQQDDYGWRVSAGYGYTNYYGDLSSYTISLKNADNIFKLFYLDPKNSNGSVLSTSMLNSYSFSIERKWTNTIGIIAQYSNNIIYGNDRVDLNGNLDPSNLNFSRALNFKSTLNDLSLGIVIRADNNNFLRSTSFLAPYLTLTAGYTHFNTKADLLYGGGIPYNYLPDGTILGGVVPDGVYETSLQPLKTGEKEYVPHTFNIGLGVGIRIRITSHFGIHAESAMRYTFSDQLDDVGGEYPLTYQSIMQEYASNPTGVARTTRGSTEANDMFIYNSISLRFSFGAPRKQTYRVPLFNPDSFPISTEQPATNTIKETVDLVSITTQALSAQPDIKSTVSDKIPVIAENAQIAPAEGNHYEISVTKKDSTRSRTSVKIENGEVVEIIIENSDAIIKGSFVPGMNLSVVTRPPARPDTTAIQSEKETFHKELLERDLEISYLQKQMTLDSINRVDLKEVKIENTVSLDELKEELNQKIDVSIDMDQALHEDNRMLTMQIDSLNRVFNGKITELQQQFQNSQMASDQQTEEYLEALRKIQEINLQRSSRPVLDPQLKEEFDRLFQQIQQYEKERLTTSTLDSLLKVEDEGTIIQLRDSVSRLQLEIKEIQDKPAEVVNKIIEKTVETLDIESIPVIEVFFGLGSTEVRETEDPKIAQTARLLSRYPDSKVILTGMADATGNKDKNLALSLQRATAVRDILVQKYEIAFDRIKVEAVGSSLSEGKTAFDRKVKMKMVKSF